ncbi:MAG TPA: DUF58 domain-containing protein [Thermoanaerobaculia bacterium]|nr:DUF58 domain-containing protein [Thermoanaerobaculia bacterium]
MRPGKGLLRLLGGWTALGLAASIWPALLLWVWVGAGVALAAVAALSWNGVRRRTPPRIERRLAPSLPLGVFTPVRLHLTNAEARPVEIEVFDGHPPHAETEGLPRRLTIPGRGWAEIEYRLRANRRGDHEFGAAEVLLHTPGDLWRRRVAAGEPQAVRVYPNFQAVAHYALFALADQLGQIGIRTQQRRGEGQEFQELREYRSGDSIRRIDWKATARRQKLISRQYQDEKNQQVVCLVDCGRRMHASDGALTHFDHVLNTVLLLSYVALRQGDAVGVMTFSGERRWLPPVKGSVGLQAILRLTYDLETSTQPSDFLEAATALMSKQKRRALVILISNLRDEDSEEIVPALRLLRTRNLVLLASLRETVLRDSLEQSPAGLHDALRTAAVHRYLAAREKVFDKLHLGNILTLDVEPEALPMRIVNRYLDIKRSGML